MHAALDDGGLSCRICLENATRDELIAPCSCRGSNKWVHRSCLNTWRSMREDKAFSRCTTCLTNYVLVTRNDEDTIASQRRRERNFVIACITDFGLVFVLSQSFILFLAVITYYCDRAKGHLIGEFHLQAHPKVFYYLCGLVFTLATVGFFFLVSLCSSGSSSPSYYYCYDPYPVHAGSNCGVCCCDCGSAGASDTCACGSADCSSGSCAAAECGEAGPFVIIVLVGLAIVGIIVVIVAGVVYSQRLVQRHLHVLNKRGLAKDYVVMDMEPQGRIENNDYFGSSSSSGGGGSGGGGSGMELLMLRAADGHSSIGNALGDPLRHADNLIGGGGGGGGLYHAAHAHDDIEALGTSSTSAYAPSAPPGPSLSLLQRRELASFGLL